MKISNKKALADIFQQGSIIEATTPQPFLDSEYNEFCKINDSRPTISQICPYCKGVGYIQEAKGKAVHTCWNCMGGTK